MTFYDVQYATKMNRTERHGGTVYVFLLFLLFVCSLAGPFSADAGSSDTSHDNWALLSGYGQSFPGFGDTTQRVETIDIIPRYNYLIFDNIGSGWYRGFHSVLLELPVSVIVSPDVSTMIGVNFLASYTFTASQQWQPYLFAGGGPVYSFADIPGMGADLNGNYQFGIGIKPNWGTAYQLFFELRYHHVSNAGTEDPNEPLNSIKFLLGVTF